MGEAATFARGGELRGEERPGLPIQVSPFLTPSPLLPHPTQHYKTSSIPVSHSPHCSLSPRLNCLLPNWRLTTGLPCRKLEGFTLLQPPRQFQMHPTIARPQHPTVQCCQICMNHPDRIRGTAKMSVKSVGVPVQASSTPTLAILFPGK